MFSRLTSALGIGLVLALAVVLGLINRLGEYRREFGEFRRLATLPHAGGYLPSLQLTSTAGDTVTVGDPALGRRQLLLVFTTTCPFCRATLPVWDSLVDSLRRTTGAVDVVGVSLDSISATSEYQRQFELPFPVVIMTEARARFLFRAGAVPQTVVVGSGGRIRYATTGRLSGGLVLDSVYRAAEAPPDSVELASGRR